MLYTPSRLGLTIDELHKLLDDNQLTPQLLIEIIDKNNQAIAKQIAELLQRNQNG